MPKVTEAQAEPEPQVDSEHTQPSGRPLRPQLADDDFEPSQAAASPLRQLPVIPPNPPKKPRSGVLELLDEAELPGVFFEEREPEDERADEGENTELDEAVEETIVRLFGVRGIHHVGPGVNMHGEPVVLISANAGFSESSLTRIPAEVRGFKTLLALPYELLPLRRER